MNAGRFTLCLTVLFLFLGAISAEGAEVIGRDDVLVDVVMRVTKRLEAGVNRRPFKFTSMNDSLGKTAAAARAMQSGQDSSGILKLLSEARGKYEDNSFAILLQAIVFHVRGDRDAALQHFEEFLVQSRTYSHFDQEVMKPREFHDLRRSIYEMLQQEGVTFEDRPEKIAFRLQFEEFMEYLSNPEPRDFVLNILLLALIFGGGLFFIYAGFTGLELDGPFTSSLGFLYGIVWLSYALWIVDLAVGLPLGVSRHQILPAVLAGSFALYLLSAFYAVWRKRSGPVAEGMRRCRHCGKVILALAIECQYCRKSQ